MRDVRYVTCCPSDSYYTWQVHLWIESLKLLGKSEKAIILIYEPRNRPYNTKWDQVISLYPEAKFIFLRERPQEDINSLIHIYIPIIREYLMLRFSQEYPQELQNAIFFCDSDILFTEDFNIEPFLDDAINYLSDTVSYMGATYIENKIREVLPQKLEEYKSKDVLQEILDCVGISRDTATLNQSVSGGAQYLLKNTSSEFWQKVLSDSIRIRKKMMELNTLYFPSQELGYQSWCADMWGILWNLWYFKKETKIISEMDFSWASDNLEVSPLKNIFHNAGITGEVMGEHMCFYKGKYHLGLDPTKDINLDLIIANDKSKKYGTWYYAKKLKELHEKYKLNY